MSQRPLAALFLIALLALGLRSWGIDHGLPSVDHDDEWQYVQNAVGMRERGSPVLVVSGHAPYVNPTGFTMLVLPVTWAVDVLNDGVGDAPRARYRADRGRYHLAARRVSMLLGVLTVLVLYWTARAVVGPRAALCAAALLAVSPLHVRDSMFATNDVPVTLFMLAAFGVLLHLVRGGRAGSEPALPSSARPARPLLWVAGAGALFGAACATKYSAAPLLPALLFLIWRRPPEARGKELAAFTGASLLAFGLLFPAAWLDTWNVIASIREQQAYGQRPWPGQDPGSTPWLHLMILARALGPLGLVLALWGWLGLLEQRRWSLAAYPALHALFVLPLAMVFARLDLPVLPFLCLAVAFALRRWTNKTWAPLLVALLLVPPAWCATRISGLMSREDTRSEVAELLAEALEGEERIRVACELSTTLRFLPRGEDGRLHPKLVVYPLSAGSCQNCGRPLVYEEPDYRCPNRTCALRNQPARVRTPEETVRLLANERVEFILLTSSTWRDPWTAELVGRLSADVSHQAGYQRAILLDVLTPARDGQSLPVSHEERYGPWNNLWLRERPGPEIRIWTAPSYSRKTRLR